MCKEKHSNYINLEIEVLFYATMIHFLLRSDIQEYHAEQDKEQV